MLEPSRDFAEDRQPSKGKTPMVRGDVSRPLRRL